MGGWASGLDGSFKWDSATGWWLFPLRPATVCLLNRVGIVAYSFWILILGT